MTAPRFHRLTVSEKIAQTADSVSIAFAIPAPLRADYQFSQGQFVTLRQPIAGAEQRRSYSVCVSVDDYRQRGQLRVGVKRVAGGLFSNWVNDHLQVGDAIDVMTPDGRFFTPLDPKQHKHYLAFAGGSGITPVLSLIKTSLAQEPRSRFTLIYGNRGVAAIMFLEELEDLKNQYLDRLTLYHVLSDEAHEIDLLHGMLDRRRCDRFLATAVAAATIDEAFVCGPEPMMLAAEQALLAAGVARRKIHVERFGTPTPPNSKLELESKREPEAELSRTAAAQSGNGSAASSGAQVEFIINGKSRQLSVRRDGVGLLDAGLAAGLDLPYACKGGVCCTCRAKILEGKVKMDKNYTLEDWEIAKGFVLTCQSHPLTDRVVVSYDER